MEKIETSTLKVQTVKKSNDRVENFQEKYNEISKNVVYIIGKNLSLFICMLVPVLLIAFVWVDFQDIIFSTKMIPEGIATVFLFAAGELLMTDVGTRGGKLDSEFINAKADYDNLLVRVSDIGTELMGAFCSWQIDLELEQAIRFRLSLLRMTPKMYEADKALPPADLEKKYGKDKAEAIAKINALKPIELNEAILLYGGEYNARGGVPASALEYLSNKRQLVIRLLICLFSGVMAINVMFAMTDDVTVARVIYTAFKLMILLYRMFSGYNHGSRAYNTIEVRNYKAKCNYLRQYIKFVEEKTYLKLGDKYEDLLENIKAPE